MSRSLITAKIFWNLVTSPALLVSLLGPIIVEVAQKVIMGNIFENHSSSQSVYAIALSDAGGRCVTNYSIQVYTVVLAGVLWLLSLLKRDYLVALTCMHGATGSESVGEARSPEARVLWFSIAALVIGIASLVFFKMAASESVLQMYDQSLSLEPQLGVNPISWMQWCWWKVNGPPIASPLSWIRLLITAHSALINSFGKWCKAVIGYHSQT